MQWCCWKPLVQFTLVPILVPSPLASPSRFRLLLINCNTLLFFQLNTSLHERNHFLSLKSAEFEELINAERTKNEELQNKLDDLDYEVTKARMRNGKLESTLAETQVRRMTASLQPPLFRDFQKEFESQLPLLFSRNPAVRLCLLFAFVKETEVKEKWAQAELNDELTEAKRIRLVGHSSKSTQTSLTTLPQLQGKASFLGADDITAPCV